MKKDDYITDSQAFEVGTTPDTEVYEPAIDVNPDLERDSVRKRVIYCTRCSQGKHNTKFLEHRCRGKDCECLCRWYYEGRDGKLRRRGTPDDSFQNLHNEQERNETDSLIDRLNSQMRSMRNAK